jgi:hypothetical protein
MSVAEVKERPADVPAMAFVVPDPDVTVAKAHPVPSRPLVVRIVVDPPFTVLSSLHPPTAAADIASMTIKPTVIRVLTVGA